MVKTYIPDSGDVVWLNFNPQTGREQAGHRPALVLSPKKYNAKSSLIIVCPITTKVKKYPFEVLIKSGNIDGAVLADQIKSLDWKSRGVTYDSRAPSGVIDKVSNLIKFLVDYS